MTDRRPELKSSVPFIRRDLEGGQSREVEAVNEADDEPLSMSDAADYLATMTAELAKIARASGLDVVGYLLEMSAEEARRQRQASESASASGPALGS